LLHQDISSDTSVLQDLIQNGFPILSPANVWGVGLVIWQLMRPRWHVPPILEWDHKFGDAYERRDACLMNLDEPPREPHPYSVELDALVYRCLAKHPSARPLPTELRDEVRDTFRRLKRKNDWKAETPDVGTGNPKQYRMRFQVAKIDKPDLRGIGMRAPTPDLGTSDDPA